MAEKTFTLEEIIAMPWEDTPGPEKQPAPPTQQPIQSIVFAPPKQWAKTHQKEGFLSRVADNQYMFGTSRDELKARRILRDYMTGGQHFGA